MNTLTFKRATKSPRALEVETGGVQQGDARPVDHTPYSPTPKVAGQFPRAKITEAPAPKSISFFKKVPLDTKVVQTTINDTDTRMPIIERPEGSESIFDLLAPTHTPGAFTPETDVVFLDDPKKFFRKKVWNDETAEELAELIVGYFSRPLEGYYDEKVLMKDGTTQVVRRPYKAPLPLLPEVALMVGLTEPELKQLGRAFPHTMGRALAMASDALKVKLIRGGLTGGMNANIVTLTATNETNMKLKSEVTQTKVDLNHLLDQIEGSEEPLV